MERTLVKHGSSTLMVSLPKKWLDTQNLGKGDAVNIVPLPDKLVVTSQKQKRELKEKIIDLHDDHYKKVREADYEKVRDSLGQAYKDGYDKIIVNFSHSKVIYYIQLMVQTIPGFEIIEHTEKQCIIKNVSRELDIDFKEILNRVTNIVRTQFILVKEYLQEGTKGKTHEIKLLRDDCWKFRNMAYVHLKEKLLGFALGDYFTIHIIEHNATLLYWLYNFYDTNDVKQVSSDFLKLFEELEEYFKGSIANRKNDSTYIEYIMENRDKLFKKCQEYIMSNKPDRSLVMYLSMLVDNIHNPKSFFN